MKLVIGLGNVGAAYADTRHNAGFFCIEALALRHGARLKEDKKLCCYLGRTKIKGQDVLLMMPTTLMNLSGKAASAVMRFYQIAPKDVLIAHDELDLPEGTVKLKFEGGHGGHNGLRDIFATQGTAFWRLRLGIGRPAHPNVAAFVLAHPDAAGRALIDGAINHAMTGFEAWILGNEDEALKRINTR